MKTIIKKAYWNYEKEENWLNKMSAKGFALTDYSWCRYVFTDAEPGEYIYRIELLEHTAAHPVSQKYLRFMEESGVEHIASYMRWVYFRKKAADGAFDIYSDIDSKLAHYKRVNLFFTTLACAELLIGTPNILIGLGLHGIPTFPMNIALGCIVFCIGIAFLIMCHPLRKRIKELKKEKLIME